MARAGHSANFAPDDSAALFLEDTLEGGARLNHPDVAHTMCADSAARIRDLFDWGIPFITREDGSFDLHPQGGHKKDRGIYPVRNWGVEVARPMRKKLDADAARILENVMTVDLLVDEGVCRGVMGFHTRSGEVYAIRASATILATGRGGADFFGEHECGRHHGRRLRGGAAGRPRALRHGVRSVLPGRHQAAREQYGGGAHAVPARRAVLKPRRCGHHARTCPEAATPRAT